MVLPCFVDTYLSHSKSWYFLVTICQLPHSRVFLFTPNNLVPGCQNTFCEFFLQLHFLIVFIFIFSVFFIKKGILVLC